MIHGSVVTDGAKLFLHLTEQVRQYDRSLPLFVSNRRVAPARRAGKFVEGRAFDSCEGIHDLETPNGVENLLDHLRTHFEPIEVFR